MKQEEISQRTKKALADALKEEMKKKPFSKITVKDITSACNLNRNTFYYHFEDIYDLLRWMFDNEAVYIVQSFDLMVDYEEAISFVIDYIEKNDHIVSCAVDSISRRELKRFFYNDFFKITQSILVNSEKYSHVSLDPDYEQFLTQFYTEALAGMLIDWITETNHLSKEKLISYLSDTVRQSLIGIFQKTSYCKNTASPRHADEDKPDDSDELQKD